MVEDLKNILNAVSGNIYYDNLPIKKSDLVSEISKWSIILKDYNSIIIRLNKQPEWWPIFFACAIECKRLTILDDQINSETLNKIKHDTSCDFEIWQENEKLCTKNNELNNLQKLQLQESEFIIYTTGTTKNPKGVIIPFHSFFENQFLINSKFLVSQNDSSIHILNQSHSMGFAFSVLCFLKGGDMFTVRNSLILYRTLCNMNFDIIMLPPNLLINLFNSPEFLEKARNMKFIATGGSYLDPKIYDVAAQNNIHIVNGYGMTECVSGIASGSSTHISNDNGVEPFTDIKIDTNGEILVKGSTVCKKYITGEDICDENGWYHTKDLGHWKGNKLYIDGRLDNVIILDSGYKVCLEDLEKRILQITQIQDCNVQFTNNCLKMYVVLKQKDVFPSEEIKKKLYFYENVNIIIVDEIDYTNNKKKYKG